MTTLPCEDLGAPVVATPLVGDEFILLIDADPNADVRVYGGNGMLIGLGSPYVVQLTRAIQAGETLVVTQDIRACEGQPTVGYEIAVVDAPSEFGFGE